MLLWLLSVTSSVAAHGPCLARIKIGEAKAQSLGIRKFVRQLQSVGGPVRHVRKVRLSLGTRRTHLQRATWPSHSDDDDAIQNDAPAAYFAVDLFLGLRQLGIFVDVIDQRTFTLSYSPRSPRGPPAAA